MRKNLIAFMAVFVGLIVVAPSAASAGPVKPPSDCGIDADGDGWCVADASRRDADDPDKPFLLGVADCNDHDKSINPGSKEIPGDGLDNDCVDGDLSIPAALNTDRTLKAFGCSRTNVSCVRRLIKEHAACDKSANCSVNYSGGKYFTTYKHYFLDTDCNGVREVVDQDGKDAYDKAPKCSSRRSSSSKQSVRKPTRRRATAKKKPATVKTSDPKKGEEETVAAPSADVQRIDSQLASIGSKVDESASAITRHENDLSTLIGALEKEAKIRGAADQALDTRVAKLEEAAETAAENTQKIEDLGTRVSDVQTLVKAGPSVGPIAEINAGVTLLGQNSIPVTDSVTGESLGNARGNTGFGPTFGLTLGAYTPAGRFTAFGDWSSVFEEGPDGENHAGSMFRVGPEWMIRLGSSAHHLGAHGFYFSKRSGGTVLESNALGEGVAAGVSYAYLPNHNGPTSFGGFARASIGYDSHGTDGGGVVATVGGAPIAMLQIGVLFGVGE